MDDVRLRPVAGADLSVLERLTQDPASTGEFAWLGWHNLTKYRQWWADNGLISDDIGILIVVRGDASVNACATRPSTSRTRGRSGTGGSAANHHTQNC